MPRLPQPGSDAGNWGNLLNDFLSTTHDSNGNLKAGSVTTAALASGSVTLAKLAISNSPTTGQTLTYDGTNLSWSTPTSSGSVPDASTSTKGLIQLAGDLGGTAAAPTVPGLAGKANTSDVVTLAGTQTVIGFKNFTGGLQASGATVVTNGDVRLTDARTPVDSSVTSAKIVNDAVTEPKLAASNTPTTGQVLSYNGTNFTWVAQASGSGDPTMGGDLSGVASNAQLATGVVGTPELATNAVTTVKITDGNISTSKLADAGVTTAKLADANVTTAKIADANVTTIKVADDAITEAKLSVANAPVSGQILSYNGTNFTWVAQPTGTATDPTVGGDLTGTASNAKLVPNAVTATELAANAVTTVKITDANVTTAKIADGAVTEAKLAASNTAANGQVLSYNGTNFTWVAQSAGSGDPTVGGDLSGTASNAQIVAGAVAATELATNAVTTVKITDANVTTAKIADANVTTAKIADASITEPKLAASNTPSSNQVLTWNGTTLVWATPAAAGGGSTWTAVTRTSAYTAASGDFVICDTTTSGYTVTLPAPANGAYVTVKKLTNNVNAVLVAPPSGVINAGTETSSTISVNSYGQVADFIADGTGWHQVG
ncbi:MAG: hypothetical protein JWN28_520 [Candidatus Saccharibacteria bacterium]|nr:hypothetical protein [Candidatus Saccharibacteria bacterium]